jgi:hypothetical protein
MLSKLYSSAHTYPSPIAFAREIEYLEYLNMQRHMSVVSEGKQNCNWSDEFKRYDLIDFEEYFKSAFSVGHSDGYIQHYQAKVFNSLAQNPCRTIQYLPPIFQRFS